MAYKRILTIQDISCVGQCSLTAALPILSAAGLETAVLPSAVLSNHTGGFGGWTFRDLTEDIPEICRRWEMEGLDFAAVYTGYLGSAKQIDYVKDLVKSRLQKGGRLIVDPAMADNGNLYPGFDGAFVKAMKRLVYSADVILPNITEACLLTGTEYREKYDRSYIDDLFGKLSESGAATIVITGVSYNPGTTGVAIMENGGYSYYEHKKIPGGFHGTGDVFASAFVGAEEQGKSAFESARIASEFTLEAIEKTLGDDNHGYGVKFELALPKLIEMLR